MLLPLFLLLLLDGFPAGSGLGGDEVVLGALKKNFLRTSAPEVLDKWGSGAPVCVWNGVKCDGFGRVVEVDLSNLNISGSGSSLELSGLDCLVNLSLAGNQFQGRIGMSNMSSLRYLNISGNQFIEGLDEWDFDTLPMLEVLDAYDNNFTAAGLPTGIVNLRKLRYLDLGGNFFRGEIPKIYGDLVEVEYLSLSGNDLRGRIPAEIGNLSKVKELYLGYFNVFDGGIPVELGSLCNLVQLDLSSCGLTGEIPNQLGDLNKLQTLFLHTNLLSERIPVSLGNLTGLVSLDLSNNALIGEIPPEFSTLRRLSLLNLFINRLHGSIPEFFATFPELKTLGLFMNNFTGELPENLGSNGKLQMLDVSSNKLTGTIPSNLCASNQLRVLILLNNFLFGSIPESLGRCSTLVRVRLGQNYLNGSLPAGFLYLPKLNLVELQRNYLTGTLSENPNPNGWSSELEQLNLSDNLFTGAIPVSFSKFSSLQTLLLRSNRFEGPIPAEISELRRAIKLDLSRNTLSEVIPPVIGNCSQLAYLDLSKNNLSGPIPEAITRLGILNYLNVSWNHLNGTVPKLFAGMKSLTVVDFAFNDLSGILPDTGQFTYFNVTSFDGNPKLCRPSLPCNPSSSSISFAKKIPGEYKLVFALSLLICSLAFTIAVILKARSKKLTTPPEWKLTAFRKVHFDMDDVLECMNDSNIIGRGGAGVVYIGRLPSGDEIAVKRLLGFGNSELHDNGFKAEIRTLGNIRHRNIVRLLAFCSDSQTNLLVYEYMSNGSLGQVLHGKGGAFLGWDMRYRIALQSARGLCYLHHDCTPIIIHRDVKSNNILLDSGFEAHVADFGLAKFLQTTGANSECMSAIAGSYGYIAPEYAYTLKVDEKSDVYSYGVVLLELLAGRRPVGEFGDGIDIVQWARTTVGSRMERVSQILDGRLGSFPMKEAVHVFFIATLCTKENSVERPTMREVVQMLSEYQRHLVEDTARSPSSSTTTENLPEIESPGRNGGTKCYKLFPDILN
ncbi:Receptor-like protein kinase [Zostera marina]|uniref:non-specific serine/threonine protein kinase n=1 Tax=Zostera marina TaxID=29655 RepID=A0A0K9PU71_ZOSMR|nr:Receptor-like protein kinase [Zostera marina]